MTRIAARAVLVAIAALTATAATAASADEIDRRQARQEQRIQQGVRSGELTRSEYRALEAEQGRIRDLERRAKADGYVSASERAQIRAAQESASRHIRAESTDNERRGGGFWRRWW